MLTFNLKREWFDKIKSGEKTHEYRVVKPYWEKRLGKHLKVWNTETSQKIIKNNLGILPIYFKCGYPRPDEKDKILFAKVKNISIIKKFF